MAVLALGMATPLVSRHDVLLPEFDPRPGCVVGRLFFGIGYGWHGHGWFLALGIVGRLGLGWLRHGSGDVVTFLSFRKGRAVSCVVSRIGIVEDVLCLSSWGCRDD